MEITVTAQVTFTYTDEHQDFGILTEQDAIQDVMEVLPSLNPGDFYFHTIVTE